MGVFKFRGAFNALAQLSEEQRQLGVVAFSSGNHAQAIALAGQLLNISTTIVMPQDAPPIKIAATKGYGGEVIFYNRYTEDRETIGEKLAQERGLTLIPPFNHPHIIAGQGTAAKELIEQAGPLDILLVCLGGGGLLSGSAIAAKALNPDCLVICVEPEAGNDAQQSFHQGKIVKIATPKTIADGAQTQALGHYTFALIQALVDDIVTVSDPQLVSTMKFFAERMKMLVEPTGCLAAAAALEGIVQTKGKRVGIIVSGGNIALKQFAQLIST